MEQTSLEERIRKAREEFEGYPEWVKQNSVFQGGERSEYREDNNPHEQREE